MAVCSELVVCSACWSYGEEAMDAVGAVEAMEFMKAAGGESVVDAVEVVDAGVLG